MTDMQLAMSFTEKRSVCALVASDPSHQRDVDAVIEAVREAACHGTVDANTIRKHLPAWVQPQCVGATISGLRARGVLVPVGWTTNTDTKGRNSGKPTRTYRYNGAAL